MIKINKKIKILVSSCLISISFISLPFRKVEAVPIAIPLVTSITAILGSIAVGSAIGINNNSALESTVSSSFLTPDYEHSWLKAILNPEKTAFNCALGIYASNFLADCYEEKLSNSLYTVVDGRCEFPFTFPSLGNSISLCSFVVSENCSSYPGGKILLNDDKYISLYGNSADYSAGEKVTVFVQCSGTSSQAYYEIIYKVNGSNRTSAYQGYGVRYGTQYCGFPAIAFFDGKISDYVGSDGISYAPLSTDLSKPTDIAISTDFINDIANEYIATYPDEGDGDDKKKPDYSQLIPFVFDLLEKKLGNGEITPYSLVNNDVVSYDFEDGSSLGCFSPSVTTPSSNDTIINNNVTVNNNDGFDVSEEEKNGILNLLDNGLRSTTERLQSLGASLTGFNENMKSLFLFLPDDVTNLIFLGICLTVVFFILGLRR